MVKRLFFRFLRFLLSKPRFSVSAKAKVKKPVIRARVYRASTGKWEDLGIISK